MPSATTASLTALLSAALDRRADLLARPDLDAIRIFNSAADGLPGLVIERLGPGATLITNDGTSAESLDPHAAAHAVLEALAPLGVRAVYHKPFIRDRSKLGGQLPPELKDPAPAAGETLDPAVMINEYGAKFEVALYDGYSTGIFLDQRDNRAALAALVAENDDVTVLNTFAYTCAFSVVCANAGARTTSVDVSGRYLKWGRRNFEHNALDPAGHRFTRLDTFEFFTLAKRKGLTFDIIILDPPSFASGNKRKGIPAWSSTREFPRLVAEAAGILAPGGVIFASTNTRELCSPGALRKRIIEGLGRSPVWLALPETPPDCAQSPPEFAACMFTL